MRLVCECEYLNAACHWLGKSCLEVLLTKWGCIDWQIPQKNSPTRKVTSSKDKVICRNAKYIVSNIDFGLSCHMQIGSQKSSLSFVQQLVGCVRYMSFWHLLQPLIPRTGSRPEACEPLEILFRSPQPTAVQQCQRKCCIFRWERISEDSRANRSKKNHSFDLGRCSNPSFLVSRVKASWKHRQSCAISGF